MQKNKLGPQKNKLGPTNLDPNLTPYTETNLEWIINIIVKAKTVKLLEENIGVNLYDRKLENVFLGMTPKLKQQKEKWTIWIS